MGGLLLLGLGGTPEVGLPEPEKIVDPVNGGNPILEVGLPDPGIGVGPVYEEDMIPEFRPLEPGTGAGPVFDEDGIPTAELDCGRGCGGTIGIELVEDTPGYEVKDAPGIELVGMPGTVTDDTPGPGTSKPLDIGTAGTDADIPG